MTYAFTFDASACSGCKACQAACKDKNQLPVGVLWRRVYEVNGGGWEQRGAAWTNTVFAYNLSMACNHCEHPKCAGVCPVEAYVIRPDGIVSIDESKCVGCGYCAWACPYGAPQYNPEAGHMTKCDFCFDQLEQGQPPACVAACPLRVLGVEEIREQREESGRLELWNLPNSEHPFPLSPTSHTQPHLVIQPHAAMNNALEKSVANLEEIQPHKSSVWEEVPLLLFTLCGQMAAGLAVCAWLVSHRIPIILLIGLLLGGGGLASFLHLGTKKNAWRTLNHLRKSWLSREVLMFGLFGIAWLAWAMEHWFLKTDALSLPAALTGLGLVHSMGQVYRLRAVPAWDTWRTNVGFFFSALLLGLLGTACILAWEARSAGTIPPGLWRGIGWGALALLVGQFALTGPTSARGRAARLRLGSFAAGGLGCASLIFFPAFIGTRIVLPLFLVVLLEEAAGRWLFYRAREARQI